jgi:hypothetical protein
MQIVCLAKSREPGEKADAFYKFRDLDELVRFMSLGNIARPTNDGGDAN